MHKPLHLAGALLCAVITIAQKTDTLIIHYKTDRHSLSKIDKQRLDSFLIAGWDRLSINGHTDEVDDTDYNIELSKKRAGEVYNYLAEKKIPTGIITSQFFGEAMPRGNNNTDEGRSINRRTEIIGYRFARVAIKPKEDPMKPVTSTLNNGLIITYRPGALPDYMAANFAAGSGMNLEMITNTVQMRQNNLYNNTTAGEILSSVMILCPQQIEPCKLDSPVLIRVPFPYNSRCPVQKVKFFTTFLKDGKRIWEEQNKRVYAEVINGTTYMNVWVDNFCGCVNFDFKVPECFEMDSAWLYTQSGVRGLSAELEGLNSVYLPPKENDSTHKLLFEKGRPGKTSVTMSLYNGKRRVRSFSSLSLSTLPYDSASRSYRLSKGVYKFSFPDVKVFNVALRVNRDRYIVYPEKNSCEVIYLNKREENILVDFSVTDRKGRLTFYNKQPISSFTYDEATGAYLINRELIKTIKEKKWDSPKLILQ